MNIKYLFNFKFIKLLSYKSGISMYYVIKDNFDITNSLKTLIERVRKRPIDNEYYRVWGYKRIFYNAFGFIYGSIFKILLLCLISLTLGIFKETIFVTLSFCLLRSFTGGLHLESYTKCAYFSVLSLIITGIFAKLVSYNLYFYIIATIFCLGTLILYAPVEHTNRPIRNIERKKLKILIPILAIVLIIIQYFIKENLSILFGIILTSITTIPFISRLK